MEYKYIAVAGDTVHHITTTTEPLEGDDGIILFTGNYDSVHVVFCENDYPDRLNVVLHNGSWEPHQGQAPKDSPIVTVTQDSYENYAYSRTKVAEGFMLCSMAIELGL